MGISSFRTGIFAGFLACTALVSWMPVPAALAESFEESVLVPAGPASVEPGQISRQITPEDSSWDSIVPGVAPAAATPDISGAPLQNPLQADDACIEELRRCCCCPNWTHYAIFDFLFLQRNNQAGNQPLVLDGADVPVITVQSLQPSIGTGFRVFYGELVTDSIGWEIGYLGIYGMFGQATAASPLNLNAPTPLGIAVNNFNDADTARATYWSSLNMAEMNVFCYDCCEECGPTRCRLTNCRRSCHCVDWLAGFVWAGLNEQASLTMDCCNPPEPATYTVNTATNYFGGQIGQRGRREWQRWAVEGWWKTALCGTNAFQSGAPIQGSLATEPERGAVSSSTTGVGFIGNLNGTLIYKLTQQWGLRAGYNAIWLTNAALAPTQFDFNTAVGAGTGINANGVVFLHGVNLGLERRW